MKIKLVIFDLDGVLVDACEWHRVALNQALKEICDFEISLNLHYKQYNGLPTRVKLNKLSKKGFVSIFDHDRINNLKQQKTIEVIKSDAKKRQEKIDLMKYLKKKKIKIGCFTNSIRETAELMLEKTGIIDLFDIILTNEDVKESKPNPEGYFKIINKLKIDEEKTIIVEDSPTGLKAARATNCVVMQVKNPDDVSVKLFKDIL